jgi:hypothetical protein
VLTIQGRVFWFKDQDLCFGRSFQGRDFVIVSFLVFSKSI